MLLIVNDFVQVRDVLMLDTHFKDVERLVNEHGLDSALDGNYDGLVLPYDQLVIQESSSRIFQNLRKKKKSQRLIKSSPSKT